MSAKFRLWGVEMSKNSVRVEELAKRREVQSELELEETLVANPEMLQVGLHLVGRQTYSSAGWLDLLGIDADGRLVIFELKRGRLGRDAVTQIIDYASALNSMSLAALSEHIAQRSGDAGIDRIDDFEDWYSGKFGAADWGRVLPPRMVLVGLGVDEAAERMVKFLCSEQLDISAVTFHAFEHQGKMLLARQVEIDRKAVLPSRRVSEPIQQRRQALQIYLLECGLTELFGTVCADLRAWITASKFENALRKGVSFQLDEVGPSGVRGPQSYFGVFAAYTQEGVVDISIGQWALKRGEAALARLSNDIALRDWPHGGQAFSIESEEDWNRCQPAMEALVQAVMANRQLDGAVAKRSA